MMESDPDAGQVAPARSAGQRAWSAARAEPTLVLLVGLAAAAYMTYSLVNFSHLGNGGFDLGIFDQVIWHYSRLELPASSLKNLGNIWGDHFSPVLIVLAPLYWVSDDARMLLLAQAVLLAAAGLPI